MIEKNPLFIIIFFVKTHLTRKYNILLKNRRGFLSKRILVDQHLIIFGTHCHFNKYFVRTDNVNNIWRLLRLITKKNQNSKASVILLPSSIPDSKSKGEDVLVKGDIFESI